MLRSKISQVISNITPSQKYMKLTLVFVLDEEKKKVLLGMKKRGFGKGKWNGFGGKVELGETIEEAAKRELIEESCIEAIHMKYRGLLLFTFRSRPEVMEVHVYSTSHFQGIALETEEMKPQWYDMNSVPYDKMWVDDHLWLPHVLNGKNINGLFHFDDEETILEHELEIE